MSWYWWVLIYLLIGCVITAIVINLETDKEKTDDILDDVIKVDGCSFVIFVLLLWPLTIFLGFIWLCVKYTKGIANKIKNLE